MWCAGWPSAGNAYTLPTNYSNAMLVIEPYRQGNAWRFDEPLLHLKAGAGAWPLFDFRDAQRFGDDMRLILKPKKH